jgi:hypothetical protein
MMGTKYQETGRMRKEGPKSGEIPHTKFNTWPGTVAHICNLNYLEAEIRRTEVRGQPQATKARPYLKKYTIQK